MKELKAMSELRTLTNRSQRSNKSNENENINSSRIDNDIQGNKKEI